MKSRTWFLLVVVLVAAAVLLYLWLDRGDGPRAEAEVVEIGAILPLTGSAAPYGKNAQNGIELALEDINQQGGIDGKPVRVRYEDSQTDPEAAVRALNQMIDIHGIKLFIGDINSSGVLAMAPIAQRREVLLLSPGASNPAISDAGDLIFRNWHSDALEGEVDARYARETLGWEKAAVLYVNAAYGVGLATTFRDHFTRMGGTITVYESYPQDTTDMRPQLSKILASNPDGLYLPGWPNEMAVALRQLRVQNQELPVLSAQGFHDPLILELAPEAAEGVVFSVPEAPDADNPVVAEFQAEYVEAYGEEPGVCSASGYDALRLLVSGIEEVGYNVREVAEYFRGLDGFPGADGLITFNENGDLLKPFDFLVAQNRTFVPVEN